MSNKLKGLSGISGAGRKTTNVGHHNFIASAQIVAIMESGSLPMKRLRDKALKNDQLIDATAGRKTRSLIVTQSNHVVLSALAPQTLNDRLLGSTWMNPAQVELEEGEFVS